MRKSEDHFGTIIGPCQINLKQKQIIVTCDQSEIIFIHDRLPLPKWPDITND